ncbi:hypothetical protein ALC62_12736 [Cyphomyrmex costatus]|uniref:Uncharacterized protein n=1 Tax=Cyphomyrmex costatus TaxID=456900 RepID=A0A151IAV3_9HYME|nr:hypothetical protein ALC62_12736 [Cyphomyrmex costatus]
MSKKTTINRLSRRHSKRKSIDSIGSGHLDPNTSIMDEEQTFWWNDLEENTFSPHSMIRTENETAMQLSSNSRVDSTQNSTTWWKNLESPNKATASTRRSAAVVKNNILQSSTSESEKEFISRKKKINLKANSRKSINNAFANALNDTEVIVPLKLRMKQVDYELHSDSDSKSSQEKLQENKEDSNLNSIEKIFKSKRSIFRPRRGGGIEDQNAFQDILTKDVLNSSTVEKSIVFEKESSKRSMDRNINVSKDHIDDHRKSIGAPQTKPLENIETDSLTLNVEKAVPETNADSSQSSVIHRQYLKPKSRFMQKARKSIEKNAFADALADSNSNSLRNRSETAMNIEVHEVNGNLHDASTENNSSMLEQSKLIPSKAVRLTRNSLRTLSEISKPANIEVHKAINNSRNDTNKDRDSNMLKSTRARLSKLSRNEEPRLTRNSLRNRSETPVNIAVHKINDNLHETSREHDSSTLGQSFTLTSSKARRLTRNSSRTLLETSKPTNVEVHEDNNSYNNINKEHDLDMLKQLSKSSPSKKDRLTHNSLRNSLRNRSETPVNIGVHKINDNLHETSREHDSSTLGQSLTPSKAGRLTRNSSRTLLETSKPANVEVHEDINNSYNNINKEHDSDMLKQLSKSSPTKKDRLTHNGSRNQSETLKSMNKTIEVYERSMNLIPNNEEDNNVETLKTSKSGPLHIITREEIHSKDNTNTGTQKSTSLSTEMEMTDGEDAESAKQTIQQNSLTKPGTSKTVNWQSVQSSSRTNIMNNREIAHRQKSLDKSQNDSIPTKSSSKDISSNKQSSSKSVRKIDDFFKVKETAMEQSKRAQKLQVSGNEKMKNLKMELEEIKSRRMAAMKMNPTGEKKSAIKPKRVKLIMPKRDTKKKKLENSATVVDKAFLVNGKVYKPPRLPRPKHWVTNRLYKFLWKRMESKYKLSTRVKSEKFMQKLVETVATVERCKNYEDYDTELEALMKEMARLKIINNRMDFYHFCQDFLPYDFRIKAIPMLLPGNKINIPYNPENVYIPLLDTNEQSLEI